MKKSLIFLSSLVSSVAMGVMCASCGGSVQNSEKVTEEKSEQPAACAEVSNPDTYLKAIDRYMADSVGSKYSAGEFSIPFCLLVDTDERDSTDILVWGVFWVDNYNLVGDTLMTVSGGSHPGLMHVCNENGHFRVTNFDAVLDGAQLAPSAKKIFGNRYEKFSNIMSDQNQREAVRLDFVKEFVSRNNVVAKYYKDYGWDAVEIK